MVLQGTVESKELKGYIINLGFKDSAKGFVKFEDAPEKLKSGSLVQVIVQSQTSKVIKCEVLSPDNVE